MEKHKTVGNPAGNPIWTKDEDDLIRKHAADGLSLTQSARIFGKSKNSVMGRAARIKVAFTGSSIPVRSKDVKAIARDASGRPIAAPKPPTPPSKLKVAPDVACTPILLTEARRCHCRFPMDDASTIVCGNEVAPGSAYCAPHRTHMTKPSISSRDFQRSMRKFT